MLLKVISVVFIAIALFFAIKNTIWDAKSAVSGKSSLNELLQNTLKLRRKLNKNTNFVFFALLLYGILLVVLTTIFSYACGYQGTIYEVIKKLYLSLDSNQYVYIAENGYVTEYPWNLSIVFFPGYPYLCGLLGKIIKNYFISSEIVSWISFALGGALFYRLCFKEYGIEFAKKATIILCLMPGNFFYMTPMSESLFLLCTVAAIYLIKTKRWFLASIAACYAGFTRITGVLVAIIFVYCLILEVLRNKKRKNLLKLFYLIIVVAGPVCYLVINYRVFGNPFIFLKYQKENWDQEAGFFFDTPAYLLRNGLNYLTDGKIKVFLGLSIPNLIVCLGVPLLFAIGGRKIKTEYLWYGIIYFVISTGVTWLLSGPRYMLPLVTIPMIIGKAVNKKFSTYFVYAIMATASIAYLGMFVMRWQIW